MSLSSTIMTSRHGSLTMLDGTATPITYSVRFDRGDFSLTGLSPDMAEMITFQARHVHIGHAKGAPTYPSFSFSMFITEFADSDDGTIQDFLHAQAPFAARVTVDSRYDGFACDIRYDADTTGDGSTDATLTLHSCVITSYDVNEADDGVTITVNGQCMGNATNYISGDVTIAKAS